MGAERERVAGLGHPEDGLRQGGDWYRWGPYVSERQWGTVREDYSADGEAWHLGGTRLLQDDPAWHDNLVFSEYFHGDNGAAIGAAHQTGWTALIANVIRRRHGAVQTAGDILRLYGQQAPR